MARLFYTKNGVEIHSVFYFMQLIENIFADLITNRAVPRRTFISIGVTAASAYAHEKRRAQKQRQQNFKSLFHRLLRFKKQPPLTTSKGRLCLQRIILLFLLQRELRELQQEFRVLQRELLPQQPQQQLSRSFFLALLPFLHPF